MYISYKQNFVFKKSMYGSFYFNFINIKLDDIKMRNASLATSYNYELNYFSSL